MKNLCRYIIKTFSKKNNIKGFTLIEITIVIAIIGILVALAIPMWNNYRIRTFNASAVSDLRNSRMDIEAYYSENIRYP